MHATALIAEDEPLLAQALRMQLASCWPDLEIVAMVNDGIAAVEETLRVRPAVVFFDIRMPGMDGIEAAAEVAARWESNNGTLPCIVFITAYDNYAVQAFERQAIDYLIKPLKPARLQQTVDRLMTRLSAQESQTTTSEGLLAQLRDIVAGPAMPPTGLRLHVIQAAVSNAKGTVLRMIPIAEVIYFEAADKYVRVITADAEYLIRTAIRELLPQLDNQIFWQVHRGTIVRSDAIDSVVRDEAGHLTIRLHDRSETLRVSRLYAHLFRSM
ncbi:MAG TPA: LytTR family DNA-binding domain-containing protein [Rhodocyclaceae bacterium]|nr:LytTR family DNA-binding domain-containing protein [Rhodocyclaceae bacterium]